MSEKQKWLPVKVYRSAVADEAADLASIRRDLEFAVAGATLALEMTPEPTPENIEEIHKNQRDSTVRISLWHASLVAYARCFGTGVRQIRLNDSWFDELDETQDAKASHRFFIEQRNKFIAHSVNRFEDAMVILVVADDRQGLKKVQGAGPFSISLASENRGRLEIFIKLAGFLLWKVQSSILEKARIINEEPKI
jgi:hypothetical protein